jgi:hypothetical protein
MIAVDLQTSSKLNLLKFKRKSQITKIPIAKQNKKNKISRSLGGGLDRATTPE